MSFYRPRAASRPLSYQAYLAGDIENVVASETAAGEMSPTARAVVIGVATGAITLIVNRLIERIFFGK